MDAELNIRLKYEKEIMMIAREEYVSKLQSCSGCEDVYLRCAKRKDGRHYYYAKSKGRGKQKYLGSEKASEVKKIRKAHFLQKAIERLDANIELIDALTTGYAEYDDASVNKALPEVYRCSVVPMSDAYIKAGTEWMKDRLAYQKQFPENYPERKTEVTSDGVWVKTISEVVLYERLKAAGLFVIYELPTVMGDYGPPVYPDFKVLSPKDMKTEIIIEYVGRLDQQRYREEFVRKLGRYINDGYKPGVDLFFVFSDRDGHIDSLQINKVIADIISSKQHAPATILFA